MKKNKLLISQSNYIPWKGYFDSINQVDVFVIYDEMQYTKRDWRNRNKLVTANGIRWITVPVEVKGKYFQKINETKIAENEWGVKHWNLIKQNYGKAPFFKETKGLFEEFYLTNNLKYLSEVNYTLIKIVCDYFDISTEIKFSKNFTLFGDKSEKLLNLCLDLNGGAYYSGPSAKGYLNEELFNDKGVEVCWLDYSDYPCYPQMYDTDFEHGVSIVDLISNTGSSAKEYLKTF